MDNGVIMFIFLIKLLTGYSRKKDKQVANNYRTY